MLHIIYGIGIPYVIKNGYEIVSNGYNSYASKSKLSDKRKANIEERRAQLKIQESDPREIQIVIEEMLAYKPFAFTLDDRYLQLEQIVDAIEKARMAKQTSSLVELCQKLHTELSVSPSRIKNAFLDRLDSIIKRINQIESLPVLRAKL